MAIRIKSERVHQLAKELAVTTGQTQVAAVERALENELAKVRRSRGEGAVHSNLPASAEIDGKRSHE